jgi:hypothetical protein
MQYAWEMRNAYKILVRKFKGKRPLGRHKHKWEDNIKMDFRETVCTGMEWIHVAQDRE